MADIKLKVKNALNNIEYCAVTLDGWTSISNNSYVGITVHFIDDDFQFKSGLLSLKYVPHSHSGINLASEKKSVINQWDLEKKVVNATVDGASNVKLAIDFINFMEKLVCVAHKINLVVKGVLDSKELLKGKYQMYYRNAVA